eukprot:m.10988 g.10988  ORF g.10988 m.10988 type:complete len:334 (+) comp2581_c0_seq2:1010-2011(+)
MPARAHFEMSRLLRYALGIASGMQYVASRGIIHRDLRLAHILLGENDTVKVCGFANSKFSTSLVCVDPERAGVRDEAVSWMAPELFITMAFSEPTDVYAYGVVLWEMYSFGLTPFATMSPDQILTAVAGGVRLDPPCDCPNAIISVMRQCWHALDSRPRFLALVEFLTHVESTKDMDLAMLDKVPQALRRERSFVNRVLQRVVVSEEALRVQGSGPVDPSPYHLQPGRDLDCDAISVADSARSGLPLLATTCVPLRTDEHPPPQGPAPPSASARLGDTSARRPASLSSVVTFPSWFDDGHSDSGSALSDRHIPIEAVGSQDSSPSTRHAESMV